MLYYDVCLYMRRRAQAIASETIEEVYSAIGLYR